MVFDGTADTVIMQTLDGEPVETLHPARSSFKGMRRFSAWDAPHLGYFLGYACWNYFTAPYVFAYPGVVSEELAPWREAGQTCGPAGCHFPAVAAQPQSRSGVLLRPRWPATADGLHRRGQRLHPRRPLQRPVSRVQRAPGRHPPPRVPAQPPTTPSTSTCRRSPSTSATSTSTSPPTSPTRRRTLNDSTPFVDHPARRLTVTLPLPYDEARTLYETSCPQSTSAVLSTRDVGRDAGTG